MPAVTDYRIVNADSRGDLEIIVKRLCSGWWVPIGGVAISPGAGDGVEFYQALVKYEAEVL